ncbi:MAG: PilN domain-containing protein [Chitinivibrionales bacterium]
MQTTHGIVPTDDGQYLMVSLRAPGAGAPRIAVKRWNCHDRIQTMLLFHRGIVCGVSSFWKSPKSQAPENTLAAEKAGTFFTALAPRTTADIHLETLAGNCVALVPDDAFLCTVPLYFGDKSAHSFISVFPLPSHYKIGLVINRELVAVFDMAPCTPEALEAHAGRISRYWARTFPHVPFPEHMYALGSETGLKTGQFSLQHLNIIAGNFECTTYDEIRALGVALARTTSVGNVPEFPLSSAKSAVRLPRTLLYAASVLMVIIALLLTGASLIADKLTESKINAYASQFQSTISNDKDIKNLLAENGMLANEILQFRDKSLARTNWALFLHALGTQRPEGLYFEMLGSEPVKGSSGSARVAFSGWARSEKLVADFIARLQKDDRISNISLSSLEKNEKKTTLCDFKIVCILKTGM